MKAILPASIALAASVLASVTILPALTPVAAATLEIADDDPASPVAVGNVTRRGESVVGTLTNRGSDRISDIRLLIDIPFLWANEVKPGDDSPARSSILTVQGPLAPHGELAFEFTPNPPLPERSDGRFDDPKVHVMGYSAVAPQ